MLYHARELSRTIYENDVLPVCICVAVLFVLKLNRHTIGLDAWMLDAASFSVFPSFFFCFMVIKQTC